MRFAAGFLLAGAAMAAAMQTGHAADSPPADVRRPIGELQVVAVTHLGKTADWVAIAPDAVWVGSTGPFAVHRIDPVTGKRVATVNLDGEPCAGLAIGSNSLWVPLCGRRHQLAKVDLVSNTVVQTFPIGPAAAEGGIAASSDSIWLVVDKHGTLARLDPANGSVRQTIHVPAGSYNPRYHDGLIWVTRAEGSAVTPVDALTGEVLAAVPTGPGPRFLTDGGGAIWTLNQGDGSVTRIALAGTDGAASHTRNIALGIPGHGGDIAYGAGMVWTTMPKVPLSAIDAATGVLRCQWVGPGGDSLGIGHGAIWLTDYHAGTISRLDVAAVSTKCLKAASPTAPGIGR